MGEGGGSRLPGMECICYGNEEHGIRSVVDDTVRVLGGGWWQLRLGEQSIMYTFVES